MTTTGSTSFVDTIRDFERVNGWNCLETRVPKYNMNKTRGWRKSTAIGHDLSVRSRRKSAFGTFVPLPHPTESLRQLTCACCTGDVNCPERKVVSIDDIGVSLMRDCTDRIFDTGQYILPDPPFANGVCTDHARFLCRDFHQFPHLASILPS